MKVPSALLTYSGPDGDTDDTGETGEMEFPRATLELQPPLPAVEELALPGSCLI